MSNTLYARLGGQEAIAAVVDRFYDRVLSDERVAHYFDDVDMHRQRTHQTQFLSAVAGGPVDYTGADMAAAHDDLEITQPDFDAIVGHLESTLAEFEVDADDRDAVLAAVGEYEDAIVTATA